MPSISSSDLLQRVVQAVYDCTWGVEINQAKHKPFRLVIFNPAVRDQSSRLNIYIWNVTHGGGPRNALEYRIQIIEHAGLKEEPGYKNLLLGWWEDVGVFAGFDFARHTSAAFSSSIQIREESLRKALLNGFALYDKGNAEIAVAFRPDFFVNYVELVEELHRFGESSTDAQSLIAVVENVSDNSTDQVSTLSAERQRVARTV
jgi:putative restriction endonuclease